MFIEQNKHREDNTSLKTINKWINNEMNDIHYLVH